MPINALYVVKSYVKCFVNGPWFLWAVWWCSFAVIIVKYFFGDNIYIYILGVFLTLVIPDVYGLSLYKYMYGYFVLSYLCNKYGIIAKLKRIVERRVYGLTVITIFIVMLFFFNYDSYIYTSGYTLIGKNILLQLKNNSFRFMIGLFGSLAALYVIFEIYKLFAHGSPKWLSYIGRQTLGIYLIQNILVKYILTIVTNNFNGTNYLFVIVEAMIILSVSLAINWLFQRNKVLNFIVLGGRKT